MSAIERNVVDTRDLDLETLAVRAGAEPDPATGSIAPPIHLSTTFLHGPAGERLYGNRYIREGNPTQERLEAALAAIESGEAAVAFASGVAAGAAMLMSLPPSSHVIFPHDLFTNYRRMVDDFAARWSLSASFVDMIDPENIRAAMRPETRLVWAESPTNPMMQIVDLAPIAAVTREMRVPLLVDNTLATPIAQRPLLLGADFVLHSTTKYFGGHSDVAGGAIILRRRDMLRALRHTREVTGAVTSPFNAWLTLRGVRSLACRVERQSATALEIARAIDRHPAIEAVLYPGLPCHPRHAIARKQMRVFGAMMSIRIRGGAEAAARVASRVKLFTNASSLGGAESLIELRAAIEGSATTTPPNLLRISVGLESARDLVDDLLGALE